MAKPEWGIKRICLSCGAKFYDFDKSPITCPKCGAEFDPEALLRARRGRSDRNKERETPKAAPGAASDGGDDIEDDEDEDAAVIESTDDLDDDEDVPGVAGGEDGDEDG